MAKSADAFRTISEVAEWLETPAHVLRFWESKFSQIKPVKRAGGRRYYRPADMMLLGGVKKLLHDDGMTIKGVQKLLREQGVKHVAQLSQPLDEVTEAEAGDLTIEVEASPVAPETAEVVSFPSAAEPQATPDPEPDVAEPALPTGQVPVDTAAASDAEAAQDTAAQPSGAPGDTDYAPASASEPEPDEPEDAAAPDRSTMPSFLRNPLTPEPAPRSDNEDDPEGSVAPEPSPAPALVLPEIPDDPDDDAFEAESGVLSALTVLRGPIDPQAARLLAELAEQLGPGSAPPPKP